MELFIGLEKYFLENKEKLGVKILLGFLGVINAYHLGDLTEKNEKTIGVYPPDGNPARPINRTE